MNKEFSSVNIVDEMHVGIVALAGPREAFDSRERWLARGARNAGVSYRAAKAFFYREWADPRSSVVDAVRTALAKINQAQEAKACDEFQELRERIAVLECRLATIDQDFHSETINTLRRASHRQGR